MLDVLFTIPYQIGDVPLFGFGLLLAIWGVGSALLVGRLVIRQGFNRDTLSYLPVLGTLGLAILKLPRVFPDGLPIHGYGVMMLLGVVSGVALAASRARRMGVDPEIMFSLAFWLFVAGITGARLFHVIEYWEKSYHKETLLDTLKAIINIPNGGLVVYGSVFGGGAAFILFARRRGIPILALGDLIAPSLMLALALGRVGCLLHGCCFGGECALPWAVTFPVDSPPYMDQLQTGRLAGLVLKGEAEGVVVKSVDPGSLAAQAGFQPGEVIRSIDGGAVASLDQVRQVLATSSANEPITMQTAAGRNLRLSALVVPTHKGSLKVHPAQVYSAIDALLLCLFLLAYYPFRRHDGEVLALMITIHPVMRFLLEFIRTDEGDVLNTHLSISQNISVLLLLAVVALWVYILRQPRGSVLPVPE